MKNVKRDQSRITFSLKFGCEVARLKVSGRLWWRYFCQEQIFLFPAFQLERQLSYMSTLHRKAHAPLRRPYQIRLPSHKKTVISTRVEVSPLDRHISDRFLCRSLALFEEVLIPDCFLCEERHKNLSDKRRSSGEHEKEKLPCTHSVDSLELKKFVDVITFKSDPTIFPCLH